MAYRKADLVEMWKRPLSQQYNTAFARIMKAIDDTKGDISLCFSGGKDSSLLADMYCECICLTEHKNKPVQVYFANTTNETQTMLEFIESFIPWLERKYGVTIEFHETRPKGNLTWAKFVLENGIPLISKAQSKAVRYVKRDMKKTGCDYETVKRLVDDALEAAGCTFDLKLRQEAQGKTDDDPFLSWGDWLKQQSDGDCIYVPGKLDIEKWEKADGN